MGTHHLGWICPGDGYSRPGWICPGGGNSPPGWVLTPIPPPTPGYMGHRIRSTSAGGTHPTGMLSCSICVLSNYWLQRSCGQGNVFTGVCLSTGGRVSASVHAGMPDPPGLGRPSQTRQTPPETRQTPPDQATPPD